MNMTRRWRDALTGAMVLILAWEIFPRIVSAAEATRFLVSYGGTAGYQLPLWVNKELGFSKKYGVDLEIILIQAGSPNIQALLGGSLQLTQTAASSAVKTIWPTAAPGEAGSPLAISWASPAESSSDGTRKSYN